jgi:hypothetical protein
VPIAARWRSLERLPPARGRDAMPGVYELADEQKRVVYIGQSAKDVPNRIRQHLERPGCVQSGARYWRYAYSRVPQADEAALLARHVERHGDLPLCNRAKPLARDAARRYRERSRD